MHTLSSIAIDAALDLDLMHLGTCDDPSRVVILKNTLNDMLERDDLSHFVILFHALSDTLPPIESTTVDNVRSATRRFIEALETVEHRTAPDAEITRLRDICVKICNRATAADEFDRPYRLVA